jgi:hypothetical protein
MGTGIWLMNRWNTLGGGGKAGAVMLVVVGTLLMLPLILIGVAVLVFKHILHRATRNMEQMSHDAAEVIGKAVYDRIHEFRDATETDFDRVDRRAYERAAREFADAGFRHLGDIVDQTLEQAGHGGAPIRVMASPDGTSVAGIFHVQHDNLPESPDGSTTLLCELTSEFDDGSFLVTSNTEGLDRTLSPPQIQRRQLPLESALDMHRARHETEKQKLQAAKDGVRCKAVSTIRDVIEMEKRQQAIKNAHRKETGYVEARD